MKDSAIKNFVRNFYNTESPIPIIITIQVALFFLLSILSFLIGANSQSLLVNKLSLPSSFLEFIYQPWSLISYSFVYSNLFTLVFDCLWLYWIGNMYLNLLHKKHFLFTFFTGLLVGAVTYLSLGSISIFNSNAVHLSSITFGLASILAGLVIISPKAEVQLILFGNISLRTIAFIYFLLRSIILISDKQFDTTLAFFASITFGLLFTKSLQNGNDWSEILNFKKRKRLKVIHGKSHDQINKTNLPNQAAIDKILDKISINGYESLSKSEKEMLFRFSKKD